MPSYKLIYLDLRGLAEPIRLTFKYAGVEFEDVRIPLEEWAEHKDGMPYKQVPVLEIDGKRICCSVAISRYLAKEFGLIGKTSFDAAKADELMDVTTDLLMILPWSEPDEEKKKKLIMDVMKERIPAGLALIEANMNGDYYAGEQITFADITFASAMDYLIEISPNILDATPKLKAMRERIYALPSIAQHIRERPITPR